MAPVPKGRDPRSPRVDGAPPETRGLPAPPRIRLTIAKDRSTSADAGGFLAMHRVDLVAAYPSGAASAPFAYDFVTRKGLDAIVVAAHFVEGGARHVYLRSAVRPPLAFRPIAPSHDGSLWELPAGIIDPGESPAEAAARELEEELGFYADASAMSELGGFTFPAPGIIGERHVFFHVEVAPAARRAPSEDGSALERFADVISVRVDEAIELCRRGILRDAKTELALRRLEEVS